MQVAVFTAAKALSATANVCPMRDDYRAGHRTLIHSSIAHAAQCHVSFHSVESRETDENKQASVAFLSAKGRR